jgi:hypothetical protein
MRPSFPHTWIGSATYASQQIREHQF